MDFPNCPKWVPKKLSWDLENENSDFFFCVFTCLIYFQVLLTSWWTHDNNINSLYSIIFGLDFVTFIIPHLLPFTFTITWYYYLSNCFVCENSEFFETNSDPHTCFIKWQNGMKMFSEDKGNIVCLCKHAKMWYFDCMLACYRESYTLIFRKLNLIFEPLNTVSPVLT